jgi:YidC/Oxa1 family membrane protein insertase
LDFGYGPTSVLQWILEHMHVYTGLPWWGTIALGAVIMRLAFFPMYLRSSDMVARTQALQSVLRPIQERSTEALKSGDQQAALVYWQQMAAVRGRAGISLPAQFAPMLLQGAVGFFAFRLIRAMSNLPVPELKHGGFLWLSDLTVPDPYGLLPIAMGAILHVTIRTGGESGAQSLSAMPEAQRNIFLYAMPGVVILVMSWQPGALCLWFTISSLLGIAQAQLLKQPAMREYFGIAPIYKPTAEEAKKNNPIDLLWKQWDAMKQRTSGQNMATDVFESTATSAPPTGKNAAYMAPQWQAPNLNTRARSTVIDVKPVIKTSAAAASSTSARSGGDDMISPNRPGAKRAAPTDSRKGDSKKQRQR